MRTRLARQPAFMNALYIINGCHKDWMVVRVLLPCKNPSYPHYDRSIFRDLRRACSLDVKRLGNGGQLCESKIGNAPLDMRAIPKAPHSAFAAISQLYGDVSFVSLPRLL